MVELVGEPLARLVSSFSGVKALVIGEALIDQYHWGRVDRMSPEAPVPIFVEERSESRRGGADNVAHQLEVLGCQVETIFPKRRCIKHRYIAGHHQLFRRDSDVFNCTEEDRSPGICDDYAPDIVVLSDYGKGFLTEKRCQAAISSAIGLGIPVVVDPKGTDWSKYQGAHVICPNEREYEQWDRKSYYPQKMVLKLGGRGLDVLEEGRAHVHIPAQARHVFDVTGAGDCVVAVVAAGLGAGGSLEEAARCATYAAGWTVGEVGTVVCPKQKLLELI